jgi:hypothetical protein
VKKMEVDAGVQPGITTNQSQRTKELEREVREQSATSTSCMDCQRWSP